MFVSPENCDVFLKIKINKKKKLPEEFVSNSFYVSLLLSGSFAESAGISFELCFWNSMAKLNKKKKNPVQCLYDLCNKLCKQ